MIESMICKYKGEQASCTCDVCHKGHARVGAKFGNSNRNTKRLGNIRNMSTVHKQLIKLGWSVNGKIITCPDCLSKMEKPMVENTKQELRQPTKSQKREIMLLLNDVYDIDNERYKGTETDKSVAECLGEGIMWGWVSQIREEYFGPDGNEANLAAAEDIQQWIESSQKVIEEFNAVVKEYNGMLKELDDIRKQGEKLIAKVKL